MIFFRAPKLLRLNTGCHKYHQYLFRLPVFFPKKMLNRLFLISVPGHKGGIICAASSRLYSQDINIIKRPQTASLKRGTGGRSSFNGNVVTVFGATGFVGRYLCNQLGKIGCQLIIPHRCDPDDPALKSLKLCGDLGQVLFQPFELTDPMSIRKAIKYSNVVINLIGRDFATKNFDFYKVHVKGAREIAAACRDMNVDRLIHVSSLNLTDKPKKYYMMKLQFLPTKLLGEEAVRDEFPNVTVFRPGTLYGYYDSFLWPLCSTLRSNENCVSLYEKGLKTIKQPLYAKDFTQGILAAINEQDTKGKIYQAVGPERFYLKDLATFCFQVLQRHAKANVLIEDIKYDFQLPFKIFYYRYILEYFHSVPCRNLAFEYIEKESVTDVVDLSLPTLSDLDVPLSKFEDVVPSLLESNFRCFPGASRTYDNRFPVEGLSEKVVNLYDCKF